MLVVFETTRPAFVRLWLPDCPKALQVKSLKSDKRLKEVKDVPIPAKLKPWVKKIEQYFEGKNVDLTSCPLDFALCTSHQKRVLEELLKIPRSQTLTYGEIAKNMSSKGYQAIGSAVGSNPLAPVVPCHRVLARGGAPGGFSSHGGLVTKEKLLRLEGKALYRTPIKSFFDQDFDAKAAKRSLLKLAPELKVVVDQAPDFDPGKSRPEAPLRALAKSIVYQQLSGKAAATIWGRVCAIGGKNLENVTQLSMEELRAAGLSQNKARALKELCERKIPSLAKFKKMSDEEIITEVSSYRGLGAWSAQMFLIFNLGRLDVFAPADLGLQKGRSLVFNLEDSRNIAELDNWGKAYSPWRTLLSWYLWRSLESSIL